jgi:hypothetical protein
MLFTRLVPTDCLSCSDKNSREYVTFFGQVRIMRWCVQTGGASSYKTLRTSGQPRRTSGHCRLKTLVFYLKTCFFELSKYVKFVKT